MTATIILVEDDLTLRTAIADNLRAQGWTVHPAATGDLGLDLCLEKAADLILLDIMLPGVNGYEICSSIRREKIETPILMLTAKGQDEDVVRGLELGADDYLVKPFALPVLLARVKALLRRTNQEQDVYAFGSYTLTLSSRSLETEGKTVSLTPKEFDLLAYFLKNPDRALSRRKISQDVWGPGLHFLPRNIDRCVKTLRKKLGPAARHIQTIRSVGYRWQYI